MLSPAFTICALSVISVRSGKNKPRRWLAARSQNTRSPRLCVDVQTRTRQRRSAAHHDAEHRETFDVESRREVGQRVQDSKGLGRAARGRAGQGRKGRRWDGRAGGRGASSGRAGKKTPPRCRVKSFGSVGDRFERVASHANARVVFLGPVRAHPEASLPRLEGQAHLSKAAQTFA